MIYGTSICFNPVKSMTPQKPSGLDIQRDSPLPLESPKATKLTPARREMQGDPMPNTSTSSPTPSMETDVQVIDLKTY